MSNYWLENDEIEEVEALAMAWLGRVLCPRPLTQIPGILDKIFDMPTLHAPTGLVFYLANRRNPDC